MSLHLTSIYTLVAGKASPRIPGDLQKRPARKPSVSPGQHVALGQVSILALITKPAGGSAVPMPTRVPDSVS